MKKAIDKGWVAIDGKPATTGDFLSGGETIELIIEETKSRLSIELIIDVLYEDDYLTVINKPAGIEVSGNRKWTIENVLSNNLKLSEQQDALVYPEAVHRLDYPTTGALLIGKTRSAVVALNQLFSNKQVTKTYLAITIGEMNSSGTISTDVDGKPSQSEYTVLDSVASERFGNLNLVQLNPLTGRRHQLRKHLSSIGNPILGDREYGMEGLILKGKGLYLHSLSLGFSHPFTKQELIIKAPTPKKFLKLFP